MVCSIKAVSCFYMLYFSKFQEKMHKKIGSINSSFYSFRQLFWNFGITDSIWLLQLS